jgi:hypothetical protein
MATPLGLRTVAVFKDTPANVEVVLGREQGNILYAEVTNKTASEVDFLVNDFPEGGIMGVAIPIPANSTRAIPIQLYNFKPAGVVTVVAYGM